MRDELISEIEKKSYPESAYTQELLKKPFDHDQVVQALEIYGAFRRLVERYQLAGVSVRCFDLLTLVKNTGCLGLALLNANGIFGGCEADLPTLLSMSILGTVSGQHAFQCNPSRVDRAANEIVFAHCTLPLDMPEKYFAGGGARVGAQVLFSKAVCGFGEKKKPPQSEGFFYTGYG